LRAFFGPGAPPYVRELLDPDCLAASGLLSPGPVALLASKAERFLETGLGEGDEMALVGVLSTQLLHEHFVRAPRLAAPAVATRAVRGAQVYLGARTGERRWSPGEPGEA